LYFMSFSTALTELVIFHPPSLKSSSSCTKFSTPSALYQLYGMLKNEQDITWVQRCDEHKINQLTLYSLESQRSPTRTTMGKES
jgi:hypothetical protein